MTKVEAYKVWAIYAEFDAFAPNTEDLIYLSDARLAIQFAQHVNKDPKSWKIAVIEGYEGLKIFHTKQALVEVGREAMIHHTMESALSAFEV